MQELIQNKKRDALEAAYQDVIPEKGKLGSWEGNDDEIDFLYIFLSK
ncbi:hypothetical protein ACFOEQ_18810 [Chryseobacterium arachidis]